MGNQAIDKKHDRPTIEQLRNPRRSPEHLREAIQVLSENWSDTDYAQVMISSRRYTPEAELSFDLIK